MSVIASMKHVEPAQTQLPVHVYFDENVFAREQEQIFRQSACYVGNEKMVPNIGDWRTLVQEQAGRILVRNKNGPELLSNVCRHRQAIMLGGEAGNVTGAVKNHGNLQENGGNIVCPLHRWTYDNQGTLLGAPQFGEKPCKNLQRFPLSNCHGLLFEGPRDPATDLARLFPSPSSIFPITFWIMSKYMSATITGKPSLKSTSKTTMLRPFILDWANSSPVTIFSGSSQTGSVRNM